MHIGCLAVGFKSQVAFLTKRVVEAESTLQAEREKANKSAQALESATTLVSLKNEEAGRAIQAR